MRFVATAIAGVFVVETEPRVDDRGSFARLFCEREFAAAGLVDRFAQTSLSHNARAGTVRGLHWSEGEGAETKLVRCLRGRLLDRLVDLRPASPTRLARLDLELSAEVPCALYVPAGVAHGFQSFADDTDLLYMIDRPHDPAAARGARWDDPAFAAPWPLPISVISDRDRTWPDWRG